MKGLTRTCVAAAAATVALVTGAVPASAAQDIHLETIHGSEPHDGKAVLNAEMTYEDRFTFRYNLTARDVCPADGYGANLRFVIRSTDGSGGESNWVAMDADGCGNGTASGYGRFVAYEPIKWVRWQLCERDTSVQPPRRGDCDLSARKDNPFTG